MTGSSDSSGRPGPALRPRDRWPILGGLLGATVLAWIWLVDMARRMADMDAGMGDMTAEMIGVRPWAARDFLLMFLMWAVMMVGMMVPTATPMALVYAQVARKARGQLSPIAPTFVFVAGYVAVWTLFSLVATLAQWALDRAALLSPMMVSTSPRLGALLLISAGLYQLSPAKNACLEHCRSPVAFFAGSWHPGVLGAFRMGLVHGAYCLGCCWILMGLLFFGGVMNLLWIAAITIFVLLEKVIPGGPRLGKTAGLAMLALGALVLLRAS